jgi:acetylglutamate kinase
MTKNDIKVFKIGGSVLNSSDSINELISGLSSKIVPGETVIVHGGGNAINFWLEKLRIEPRFINGQRVTDEKTIQVVEMVLSGLVNKELVSILESKGFGAAGLSGRDRDLARAEIINEELGFVGKVNSVKADIIHNLLENSIVPVLSPVCNDSNGAAVNVNADFFVSKIAGALNALELNMITSSGGVFKDGELIESIDINEVDELIKEGIVTVGMIPKLQSAVEAISNKVGRVNLLNYKGEIGTVIQ